MMSNCQAWEFGAVTSNGWMVHHFSNILSTFKELLKIGDIKVDWTHTRRSFMKPMVNLIE